MTDKERFVIENYNIYPDGRIYSPYTNKFLKFRVDKDGYLDVSLIYDSNGNRQPFRVHRLVALKYIDNPNNYPVINHRDNNKQNNNVSNLEWCTVAYNTQFGYNTGSYKSLKKVRVIEPDGEVKVFVSVSSAARYYGYSNLSTIQAILDGRRNNPIPRGKRKGLYFEYTDEGITTIERVVNTVINE